MKDKIDNDVLIEVGMSALRAKLIEIGDEGMKKLLKEMKELELKWSARDETKN